MLFDLLSWQDLLFILVQFFQTGGWVLYPIFMVSLLILILVLERVLYQLFSYPGEKKRILSKMQAEPLFVKKISILCDLDIALKSHFSMIKTLIALCPLIGLLGTVTGMIQVFDSLALFGTGNPRLMAAGVASATFPIMTGMAVALVGILFYNRLSRWSANERQRLQLRLNRHLNINHGTQ